MTNYVPTPLDRLPLSALEEMARYEVVALGWTREQTRQFSEQVTGKSSARELTNLEWLRLIYAMRSHWFATSTLFNEDHHYAKTNPNTETVERGRL